MGTRVRVGDDLEVGALQDRALEALWSCKVEHHQARVKVNGRFFHTHRQGSAIMQE